MGEICKISFRDRRRLDERGVKSGFPIVGSQVKPSLQPAFALPAETSCKDPHPLRLEHESSIARASSSMASSSAKLWLMIAMILAFSSGSVAFGMISSFAR